MKRTNSKLLIAICFLAAFVLWTAAVCIVDVQPIGPQESVVGFAAINGFVHELTGVHMKLYTLTDLLSIVPLGFVCGFAILGLAQFVKAKSLRGVDGSILALGGFYIVMAAGYLLFEAAVINYRPVLIGGALEASYPSSTTVLVTCVMPTAVMQVKGRIRNLQLRRCTVVVLTAFSAAMVVLRLISGVHWFSDIVGGMLFSVGLVKLYSFIADAIEK